ncbi:MAG: HEAT repeat domain-containing protein [Nitrospirae bacterium]|nr:HEAT repeat domain-containing protein [Nitrospirota bacterium]
MDPEIRGTAVKTLIRLARPDLSSLLGEVDPEAFFDDLIGIYRDVDSGLYPAVIQTFAYLENSEGCRPVLELAGEVNIEDPEILEAVLDALVRLRNEECLISALSTGTAKMIHVAVTTLGRMKSAPAISPLMSLFPSAETELRVDILLALGEIGDPESLSFLIVSLEDEVSHVRRAAASALGQLGIRSAVEPLFAGLEREEYRDVMEAIVRALVAIDRGGTEEVPRGLSDRMAHPNAKVREAVARVLGELNHPEGMKALLQGMNDSDWRVRKSSVEALGRFRGAEIGATLVHGTWDEREEVRLAALQALVNRKGFVEPGEEEERIVDAMIAALRDDHLRVRCRAVEALKQWGARRAILHLMEILQREKGPIQILSIEALGALKAGEAEGLLRLAAGHQDRALAGAASEALSRVTE